MQFFIHPLKATYGFYSRDDTSASKETYYLVLSGGKEGDALRFSFLAFFGHPFVHVPLNDLLGAGFVIKYFLHLKLRIV